MAAKRLNNNGGAGGRVGVVMLLSDVEMPWGGTAKQAVHLACELQSREVTIAIVSKKLRSANGSSASHCQSKAHQEGNVISFVRLPILSFQPAWSFFFSFLIWAGINRNCFQIIHAHSPRVGVIASLVGWLMRKRVVTKVPSVEHVGDFKGGPLSRELRRWILTKGTASFIAVSKELAQGLRDAGISPQKITLIPNGIDLTTVASHSNRSALKSGLLGTANCTVVLYVGRLIEEKGLDHLFAVWASMPSRNGAVLLIVGDGPLRKDLESRVGDLQILSSVRFLGHQADVSKFYAIADLFVLPSRTEGMSNALLEAMAGGIPVVASDTGGNRDLLEDQSGILLDWTNTAACAQVLSSLLSDANLRSRLGICAKRRADEFSLAEVASHYRRLYHSVLRG